MYSRSPLRLTLLISALLVSACASSPPQPPVQIVDATPKAPALPTELLTPARTDQVAQTESLLTAYYSSRPKPPSSPASATSSLTNTK